MCFCSPLAAQVSIRRWQHFNIVQSSRGKKTKQKNLNLHVQKAESSLHSDRMYTLLPWIYGLDEFMRLWTGRKVKF